MNATSMNGEEIIWPRLYSSCLGPSVNFNTQRSCLATAAMRTATLAMTRVPNMEEMSQMTQTARVWGKMLGRMQRDADRIEEADRYDDQMDKTTEAYEEMFQIELEYEMHASNYIAEDTHERIEQLDYEIDQIEQMQEMEQKINERRIREENGSYAMTSSEAANMEAYEEMFQYERQHHCTN